MPPLSLTTACAGKTALVTGASSGLGMEFARQLAAAGCQLILVARRQDRLESLRQELQTRHQIRVDVIPADLADPDSPPRLYAEIQRRAITVDVLINNAGFGLYGEFLSVPWPREREMLAVDLLAVVHLTKLFAAQMAARKSGQILLISSIGAYQPSPTYAVYSAAKTFILFFGEALHYELRATGVNCTVVSPGITATDFLAVAGQAQSRFQRLTMMTSAQVVRIALRAMVRRRPSCVPGLINGVLTWATRLVPRQLAAAITYRLMTVR